MNENVGYVLHLTLPLPPSVNHCYTIRRGKGGKGLALTKAGRLWKEDAQKAAKEACQVQRWQRASCKTVIECVWYWPDNRPHDANNLHKLLCDSLQGSVYVNDRVALVRDMNYHIEPSNPRVEITIYRLGEVK